MKEEGKELHGEHGGDTGGTRRRGGREGGEEGSITEGKEIGRMERRKMRRFDLSLLSSSFFRDSP
jgi:hypothetical protein